MSDARVLSMLESISERLARLETAVGAGPAKPTAASIAEFDELIRAEVEPFAALSAEIDASVGKMVCPRCRRMRPASQDRDANTTCSAQGDVVLRTFRTVRNVLELATQHQKPSPEGLQVPLFAHAPLACVLHALTTSGSSGDHAARVGAHEGAGRRAGRPELH